MDLTLLLFLINVYYIAVVLCYPDGVFCLCLWPCTPSIYEYRSCFM